LKSQNKLIEGEDFIIRLKVINALPKTPPERGIVVEADAVIAMELPNPNGKKRKTMNDIVFFTLKHRNNSCSI
jgi:hypothetical protein